MSQFLIKCFFICMTLLYLHFRSVTTKHVKVTPQAKYEIGPVSSKAIQAPEVRMLSLASTSTWTVAFRDCRLQESLIVSVDNISSTVTAQE